MAPRAVDLVGRHAELSWLGARLRLAAQGAPQCVLLSGEAGIGKTRLAAELCDGAHGSGFLTLAGRGYDGVSLPFLPFREAIFPALARLLDDSGGVPSALTMALGEEDEAGSRVPLSDIAPVGLLLDLANLVLEAAARRPLLLVVDDLQWADTSSLALVRHVIYRLEGGFRATRLLLLLAARPTAEIEPLRREHRCAAVELAGLDALESADLVRRLGGRNLTPGNVWEQTGGNPLLIEALARSGSIVDAPLIVETAIDARMESLSAPCVEMLEWAALLIPDLALASLRRLGRWDEGTVVMLVDEALLAGVLIVDGMSLRFSHPLVRARFMRRIGPLARARAHAEIAHALGPPEGSSVVSVARHLVLAGGEAEADEVAEVALSAARQASALCAWEEAAGLFKAVLAAQPRCSAPASVAEQAALHWSVGKCRQFALDVDGGRRDFERAAELGHNAGDLEGELRATLDRLVCLTAGGPVAHAEVQAVEALVEALGKSAPALAAEALVDISQAQWSQGRVEEARTTIAPRWRSPNRSSSTRRPARHTSPVQSRIGSRSTSTVPSTISAAARPTCDSPRTPRAGWAPPTACRSRCSGWAGSTTPTRPSSGQPPIPKKCSPCMSSVSCWPRACRSRSCAAI